jgi:hypothetical protein
VKRNDSVERAMKMHMWHPRYKIPVRIVPPLSVVRLAKRETDWDVELQVGDTFRIGYYSVQDGPNCVWLVDAKGNYCQTWDQSLSDHFEIVNLSNETDIFGRNRPKIGKL